MSKHKFTMSLNGQHHDIDLGVLDDAKFMEGCRTSNRLDPTDPRYVIIEQRMPAAFYPGTTTTPSESAGSSLMVGQILAGVFSVASIVFRDDADLAREIVDHFVWLGLLREGQVEFTKTPPEGPSS